jgi:hypothetical protein
MGIQIAIQYRDEPVTYDVTWQEDQIYQLRLNGENHRSNGEYIPEKIIIRRKGKIWISDMDNYDELVKSLTEEIIQYDPTLRPE